MKILICGDSFSVNSTDGWTAMLASNYTITNLSQAGCSEYRILKQLQSVTLANYDLIIINHTSPYRVYIKEHPIHKKDKMHHSCDLLYNDVLGHSSNKTMSIAKGYFETIFDIDHAKDIYQLLLEKIDQLTSDSNTIHCCHLEWDNLYEFKEFIYFNSVWKQHPGNTNHYSLIGNQTVYNILKSKIIKIYNRTE